jgi:hypothetical protein
MTKSEMEQHWSEYQSSMTQARSSEENGLYRAAVDSALSAWDHIDGMLQYERKYAENSSDRIMAIEIILKYSPLLLNFGNLNKLEALLQSSRRIEKTDEGSLNEKLASARAEMWENHRLWSYLEANPGARQDELRRVLGGDQDYWREVAGVWEKMGLLHRVREGGSYRLAFATRMGALVAGKCPSCGGTTEAPKAMLLEPTKCPECRKTGLFVILATPGNSNTKG